MRLLPKHLGETRRINQKAINLEVDGLLSPLANVGAIRTSA